MPEPSLAGANDVDRSLLGLFFENFQDDHGPGREMIEDPPVFRFVGDAKFVAAWADDGHGPRVGESEQFTPLQATEQHAGFHPGGGGKRRRLDLAVQPDQGFFRPHRGPPICQM